MQVAWTRPALRDLDDIQDFVARDNPAAAAKLVGEILDRTDGQLAGNPKIGRTGRVRGTRELILPGIPYICVYRVTDQVEIVAVMHTSRSWPRRFP
jgi:addiction module RelE/StbE family toxin